MLVSRYVQGHRQKEYHVCTIDIWRGHTYIAAHDQQIGKVHVMASKETHSHKGPYDGTMVGVQQDNAIQFQMV